MTNHTSLPGADQAPEPPDELIGTEPGEVEGRPRWYWPLFAVMLVALAVSMVVWPVVVYQALIP